MVHNQRAPKSAKKTQKKLVRKTNNILKQTKKKTIQQNISLEKLKQLSNFSGNLNAFTMFDSKNELMKSSIILSKSVSIKSPYI